MSISDFPPTQSISDTTGIPLSKGKVALIDADDFASVSAYKWCVIEMPERPVTMWYAITATPGNNKKKIYLHRFIMDAPKGTVVDHINGDTLDNRRSNLRVCTYSQNNCNAIHKKKNRTGYRGVSANGRSYVAQIVLQGIRYRLGSFPTPKEAAVAYDRAAINLHGEFASLNFPDEVLL